MTFATCGGGWSSATGSTSTRGRRCRAQRAAAMSTDRSMRTAFPVPEFMKVGRSTIRATGPSWTACRSTNCST